MAKRWASEVVLIPKVPDQVFSHREIPPLMEFPRYGWVALSDIKERKVTSDTYWSLILPQTESIMYHSAPYHTWIFGSEVDSSLYAQVCTECSQLEGYATVHCPGIECEGTSVNSLNQRHIWELIDKKEAQFYQNEWFLSKDLFGLDQTAYGFNIETGQVVYRGSEAAQLQKEGKLLVDGKVSHTPPIPDYIASEDPGANIDKYIAKATEASGGAKVGVWNTTGWSDDVSLPRFR